MDTIIKDLITFEDEDDFRKKVAYLYHKLDEDDSGGLTFEEFRDGVRQLKSCIHLAREDFDVITEYGKHLNPQGEFSSEQFQAMMKRELWRYSRRQLSNVLSLSGDEQFRSTILMQKIFEVDVFARLDTMEAQLKAVVTAFGAAPACAEGQRRGGARTCSKCAGRTLPIDANYCWKCGELLEPLQECSKQNCENVVRGAGAVTGDIRVVLEGRTAIADLVIVKPNGGGDGNARAVPRHVTVHGLQEGLDAENETVGQAIYVTAASAGAGFSAADKGVRSFSMEPFLPVVDSTLSASTDMT